MKDDLAGGQLPSGLFGANAAWWQMMILALNLNAALKRLALGENWEPKRMKAIRLQLINLPGRVVWHANRFWILVTSTAKSLQILLSVAVGSWRWRIVRVDSAADRHQGRRTGLVGGCQL